MKSDRQQQLDARDAEDFLRDLQAHAPAYLPGWQPRDGSSAGALLHINARYLEELTERINQAPDKNKLAFLDQLGVQLIPAQAARAPLVFEPMPNLGNSRIPAGTRAGAKVPGLESPLVFETESDIALSVARLAEVVSVVPGRDCYANHSQDVLGRQPFTLFQPLLPVPHILYLGHDLHFALAGQSSVELEFGLSTAASRPLSVRWEYWDGEVWQAFQEPSEHDNPGESFDGTRGFTRSGALRLVTGCAETKTTKVNGMESYWVRGVLSGPLPPDPAFQLPQVERIRIRTVIDRSLPAGCQPGHLPELAFAGAQKADLTKTFTPLGNHPQLGTAFYIVNDEAFSKPGALVTVCFQKAVTAQDKADEEGRKFEAAMDSAADKIAKIKADAKSVVDILSALLDANNALGKAIDELYGGQDAKATFNAIQTHMLDARSAAWRALPAAMNILNPLIALFATVPVIPGLGLTFIAGQLVFELTAIIRELSDPAAVDQAFQDLENAANNLKNGSLIAALGLFIALINTMQNLITAGSDPNAWDVYGKSLGGMLDTAQAVYDDLKGRLLDAKNAVALALVSAQAVVDGLEHLSPLDVVVAAGQEAPDNAGKPKLAWEYWNGSRWIALNIQNLAMNGQAAAQDQQPGNFTGSGMVQFRVPQGWETVKVNGETRRWLRVRLAEGSFDRLRMVTWSDASGNPNVMPVLEPHPPALDGFSMGYLYHSPKDSAQTCLAYNDFRWADYTWDAAWRGAFAPYQPVEDRAPTLYLGFDQPLPADLVSLYLDIEEVSGQTEGPPLTWEFWDGGSWQPLTVRDSTQHLALPGLAAVLWPGVAANPTAQILNNAGKQVQLLNARQAAQFQPGQLLYLLKGEQGELATLEAVNGAALQLKVPPGQSFTGGTIQRAALPRFGTPRYWLRARMQSDGTPRPARINGIDLNAVWAVQTQTLQNEVLGSGNAQPRQAFFLRLSPVLGGQVIEVRELEGARAEVELPILQRDLERQGLSENDLRTVADPATGKIREVWVRWQVRDHLLFSTPDDRHYVIERSQGRVQFGDGRHGRMLPAGSNNILARTYRAGGGLLGNVSAGAISQLMSGVLAQKVSNPRAAEGGADGETLASLHRRGPQVLRHRRQAISLSDYEDLAREASPAVAVARALPATHPSGRSAPGWVRMIVIPQSQEPQPQPSFELRRLVREFLAGRVPAAMARRISVSGPEYLAIGVDAAIAPRRLEQAGPVLKAAREALERFLHPLLGGPEGQGWPFGRDIYLSDIAALLEAIDGIDYVASLNLLLDQTPQGERIDVPDGRIVVAGPLEIRLIGAGS